MSGRWWRAYDEALHDPKLIALSDKLHRAWFAMLCVASKHGGILPAMAVVAIELRITLHKAAEYVTALVTAGLIDEIETGKFAPHNWQRRQFQSDVSTDRVKRFRNKKKAVPETPPDNREQKQISEAKASAPTQAELERELFRRGAQVCGRASGGLIAGLLKSKQHDVALARSVVEMAATKHDPREFVAAATRSGGNGNLGTGLEIRGSSAGDRARELAQLAREREAEAGFPRPPDAVRGA